MPEMAMTTIELDITVIDVNGDWHLLGSVRAEVPDAYFGTPTNSRMEFSDAQVQFNGVGLQLHPRVFPSGRGSLSVV